MARILDIPLVFDPCTGSSGGTGGFGGTAGSFGTGGSSAGEGSFPGGAPGTKEADAAPAPSVPIALPSADEPVDDLQKEDEKIREKFGKRTLGGRSAKSTH
jgi:hypothetical protein